MNLNQNRAVSALRLCVTLLVLLHHTILAYCVYGHFNPRHYLWSSAPIIDRQRWISFDIIQDYNDTYFMSLMFLVSGLFVLPSLHRKGNSQYMRDRIWRLGLPFVVCVTLIMPIAYYPSFRQTGADLSFGQFWSGYFTHYDWPGGPAWFIWFLLVLDLLCSTLIRRYPGLSRKVAALPDLIFANPARALLVFLVMALAAYLPIEALAGSSRWFSLGPFAVQESRVGLYALFFMTGAAAGAAGIHHPLFRREGPVGRNWTRCGLLAAASFGLLLVMQLAALHHRVPWSGPAWQAADPVLFVLCCVFSSIALAGLFIRHWQQSYRCIDRLAASAYGIYLVHYAFLTWAQTALLRLSWSAIEKAITVFVVVLAASWALTSLLRRSRLVRRVL